MGYLSLRFYSATVRYTKLASASFRGARYSLAYRVIIMYHYVVYLATVRLSAARRTSNLAPALQSQVLTLLRIGK